MTILIEAETKEIAELLWQIGERQTEEQRKAATVNAFIRQANAVIQECEKDIATRKAKSESH